MRETTMTYDNFNQPDVFQDDLLTDEKLLWKGQPDRSVIFNKSDIFTMPFGLLWLGILSYNLYVAYMHGTTDATVKVNDAVVASQQSAMLINFTFMAIIGLMMTVGRLIARNIYKRCSYYAITNQRILFITKFFGKSFKSEYINTLTGMNKSIKRTGIGTIGFDCSSDNNLSTKSHLNRFTGMPPSSFCDIQDANKVYQMITELRHSK